MEITGHRFDSAIDHGWFIAVSLPAGYFLPQITLGKDWTVTNSTQAHEPAKLECKNGRKHNLKNLGNGNKPVVLK
jgi:hypothetical protein